MRFEGHHPEVSTFDTHRRMRLWDLGICEVTRREDLWKMDLDGKIVLIVDRDTARKLAGTIQRGFEFGSDEALLGELLEMADPLTTGDSL